MCSYAICYPWTIRQARGAAGESNIERARLKVGLESKAAVPGLVSRCYLQAASVRFGFEHRLRSRFETGDRSEFFSERKLEVTL